MTLAQYRGEKRPPKKGAEAAGAVAREASHPGPAQYVRIGVLIVLTEAAEISTFYLGLAQWASVGILMVLMIMNFGLIALWFMHLKFDSPLFSTAFVGGLLLTAALFVVVLATLGGGFF